MDYFGARPEAKRVLLMPGSRKQEVLSLLDVMLESGGTFVTVSRRCTVLFYRVLIRLNAVN